MLSVVILSYNTREVTLECLARLKAEEIIVIDNNSSDGSAEAIAKKFPKVKLVRNKENVGFAKGNNQGMKMAKGDKILLLNSDCWVEKDTLQKIYDLNKDVAGCKLVNKDGSLQPSWGYFPTWRRIIQLVLFVDNFPGVRNSIDSIHIRNKERYESEQEADWVTGAFTMIKREVFEQVGGIDENYFMYGEEMEWMYRMKQAGFNVWYSPIAWATHLGKASTGSNAKAIASEYKGYIYWFKKYNYPAWQQTLLPWILKLGSLYKMAGWAVAGSKKNALENWGVFKSL